MINSNTYSQRGRWEQGQSPVGGDCYHTILNPIFKTKSLLFFIPDVGAMAIAPYGFLENQKVLLANDLADFYEMTSGREINHYEK